MRPVQRSQGNRAGLEVPPRASRRAIQLPAVRRPHLAKASSGHHRGCAMKKLPLTGKAVLFFAGPVYEDLELWYPKIRLEEEGARTVVAGLGEREYRGKHGYPVTVDMDVDKVEASDFDGLVIPGGFAPDRMRRS